MLTVKRRRDLRDRVAFTLNACRVKHIGTQVGPTGKQDLRIEIDLDDAGNCFDSKSLNKLLLDLQDAGYVDRGVLTMWFGFNNHQPQSDAHFKIWCSGFKGE